MAPRLPGVINEIIARGKPRSVIEVVTPGADVSVKP